VRPTVASPPATDGPLHDPTLELVLDDNRISHQQREILDRPENYLRPVRVRERWRPTPTAEGDAPRVRRNASQGRSQAGQRLSRVY
jgi:hypothetical protein